MDQERKGSWLGGLFNRKSGGKKPALPGAMHQSLMSSTSMETPRGTLRAAWKMMRPYWSLMGESGKKEKAIAYALLSATLATTVWGVNIQVELANWSREWGDVLQKMFEVASTLKSQGIAPGDIAKSAQMAEQAAKFGTLFTIDFPILVGKFLTSLAIGFTAIQHLGLRWRTWETERIKNAWLTDKAFYKIQSIYKNVDNPDQRIQEDINHFTSGMPSLLNNALSSTLSLGTFSVMLWNIGGPFMFFAAIGYAALGTGVIHKIGSPLARIFNNQQKVEANLRSELVRVRENAEQIALNNGEEVEKGLLKKIFDPVVKNSKTLITKQKQVILTRALYANMASPFPYLVSMPQIVTGAITYGGLRQVAYAFSTVQDSLNWFIDNYQTLMNMKAVIKRLGDFNDTIEHAHHEAAQKRLALATPKPA